MSEKKLYSVTALFNTPDEISKAAEVITNEGYKNFDVNTPYPVHGLSSKMKLKPSTLGYFALALGLSGATIALLFMYWTMSIDYPMIIGGKPFFALPAFIPVTFEVTVLLASVGTVLVMLFLFFKLPNNSHPLHDTEYMKKVSNDKFGISIEAKDPKFNLEQIKELFASLGAEKIEEIYYDEEEINHKNKIFEPKFIAFLFVVAIVVAGGTYFTLNKLLYMSPFNFMLDQHRVDPQAKETIFQDGFGMRPPVEGTVARGFMPYLYQEDPEKAGMLLSNPLMATEENLKLGQNKYNTFCSPCHGYFGKGDSRLNGQFPNPPSLQSEKLIQWQDGRIYHVIQVGQNIMPSYAKQLTEKEKWAIVLYIRALQRALNAKEEDLK
ncbi:MAG: DUF3341 domain-containing protein [Candidatus Kapabacteria bacterium]|nr:DUF3341 domain-containing protein [Candidatus Kapabacteria bacterium]